MKLFRLKHTGQSAVLPSCGASAQRHDGIRWLARRGIPLSLLLLACLCLLVRLTVRDEYDWSAALFYIGPWPLLVVAWPVLAVWLRAGRFFLGLAAVGLLVTFAGWHQAPFVPMRSTMETEGVSKRILFWNIGHPKTLPSQLEELMMAHQPDIVVLAEAEKLTPDALEEMQRKHPPYQLATLRGGLLAAVKGTAKVEESVQLVHHSNAHRLRVEFSGESDGWYLVTADLGPMPLTPRLERTERIRQLAGSEPRTLVVGDFNTPYDSVAFDRWRNVWFHGLSQVPVSPGAATWPFGLPLLSIDHVWLSKDLWPRQAWKETLLGYDHAWQVIEFSQQAH